MKKSDPKDINKELETLVQVQANLKIVLMNKMSRLEDDNASLTAMFQHFSDVVFPGRVDSVDAVREIVADNTQLTKYNKLWSDRAHKAAEENTQLRTQLAEAKKHLERYHMVYEQNDQLIIDKADLREQLAEADDNLQAMYELSDSQEEELREIRIELAEANETLQLQDRANHLMRLKMEDTIDMLNKDGAALLKNCHAMRHVVEAALSWQHFTQTRDGYTQFDIDEALIQDALFAALAALEGGE